MDDAFTHHCFCCRQGWAFLVTHQFCRLTVGRVPWLCCGSDTQTHFEDSRSCSLYIPVTEGSSSVHLKLLTTYSSCLTVRENWSTCWYLWRLVASNLLRQYPSFVDFSLAAMHLPAWSEVLRELVTEVARKSLFSCQYSFVVWSRAFPYQTRVTLKCLQFYPGAAAFHWQVT